MVWQHLWFCVLSFLTDGLVHFLPSAIFVRFFNCWQDTEIFWIQPKCKQSTLGPCPGMCHFAYHAFEQKQVSYMFKTGEIYKLPQKVPSDSRLSYQLNLQIDSRNPVASICDKTRLLLCQSGRGPGRSRGLRGKHRLLPAAGFNGNQKQHGTLISQHKLVTPKRSNTWHTFGKFNASFEMIHLASFEAYKLVGLI